jgi:hypothetical protein
MPKDQNVLDIVQAITSDLRHNKEFCSHLQNLDAEASRRLARNLITLLYQSLERKEPPQESRG